MRAFGSPFSPSLEPDVVREHLGFVLSSPQFAKSKRLQRFLEFIVECELAGRRRDIQEFAIGLEVFDRRDSFDPRSDSIVRVEARRLRRRLQQYYAGNGRRQPIRIVLPQRGYVPSFERRRLRPAWAGRAVAALITAGIVAVLGYALYSENWASSAATPSPAAREAFEKGKAAFEQWTGKGAQQAEVFFQEAIAHDSNYARAHSWLSAAYRQQAIMGEVSFQEAYAKSSSAAQKAVALDPQLAEAHLMVAITLTFEPRWREAEEAFRTAIRMEPDNATSHHTYGVLLLAASAARLADAEAELRKAVQLQPGDLTNSVVLAKVLYFRGRLSEARVALEEVLRIDPLYPDAMRNLAAVLIQMGEQSEAIRLYETAQQLAYVPWGDGLLGHAFAVSGDESEARTLLANLNKNFRARPVAALAIGTIQVGLGQWDSACESLLRAWTHRELRTRYIAVDPLYAPMRDRPCFRELVDEMSLADLIPSH